MQDLRLDDEVYVSDLDSEDELLNIDDFIDFNAEDELLNIDDFIDPKTGQIKIADSHRRFNKIYNNLIKEIKNNKKVAGSEPEERYYHWSSQEKDFMFDKPGLTTWEKDRQREKEYLKSMGMLK